MQIFNVGSDAINIYLIDSGSHRLLIDSGFPNKLNDLGREMRKTGFKIRDIDYLIVTHFHIDHAGAIQELKEQGVKFILFDIQIGHIGSMERMAIGKWEYLQLNMRDNIIMSIDKSTDFLNKMGLQAQVISTPGHSDDSITLLFNSGEAFIGDLCADYLADDKDSINYKTWIKLKGANARIIYPSHGKVYEIKSTYT
ncbi:MAG: MBL fold metallo-hydrolase [Bacteroidales bacterium]|nr:MBL fold metallo-hydrolase [Bacteroidales bacterium]